MKKLKKQAVYETKCDATNVLLSDCIVFDKIDKGENLGCTIEINGGFGAIADGSIRNTFHLSEKVTLEILQYLSSRFPKFAKSLEDAQISKN